MEVYKPSTAQNINLLKLYTHDALPQRTITIEIIIGQKTTVVWYVMPCSLVEFTNFSEEPPTSILRTEY
jgi:hypothetical protein